MSFATDLCFELCVVVDAKKFSKAVERLRHAASGPDDSAKLGIVCLEALRNELVVTAVHPSGSVQTTLTADVVSEGTVHLYARELARALRSTMKPGHLAIRADGSIVNVEVDDRTFALESARPFAAAEFPSVDCAEHIATISGRALGRMLRATLPCASQDCTRVALSTVCLEMAANAVTAVATDGHRLTRCIERADIWVEGNYLLDARGATELARALDDRIVGPVEILASATRMWFQSGVHQVSVALVHEKYPDWRSVMSWTSKTSTHVRVSGEHLSKLMRGVPRCMQWVDLETVAGELSLCAGDTGTRFAARCIPAVIDGPRVVVRVCALYLRDAVNAVASHPDVTLGFSGELDPVTLEAGTRTVVVMPIRR